MQRATTRFATARNRHLYRGGIALIGVAALAACEGPMDLDMRRFGDGFNTTEAALNAAGRPAPDARGVISYPNYQVVVAQRDDTARTIATRLGLDADALAAYNGIAADAPLRRDEVIALPTRVAAAAATAAAPDVLTTAAAALDRVGDVTTTALPSTTPATAAPVSAAVGSEPARHQVQRGETVYSIARLFNVPVTAIVDWNALGPDLAVREGQQLIIPQAGATPPALIVPVTAPGTGTTTPVPPSAAAPLPEDEAPATTEDNETTTPAPDLGSEQTTAPATSAFVSPVQGSIIRAYAPGRNEGIDIGVPAGTPVRAAAAGTVAAITTNTEGIQIVVIRHADNLLTVYTHVDGLTVAKDATVTQGQTIGAVRAGDPSFLHFEVRRGMQSQDPGEFLP